jgi:hypothetical protein
LVGGDHDAAFEDEMDAVADNIHAGIIFRVPAPTFTYHSVTSDVNLFYFLRGFGGGFILEERDIGSNAIHRYSYGLRTGILNLDCLGMTSNYSFPTVLSIIICVYPNVIYWFIER